MTQPDAKTRILQATRALLDEMDDPTDLTVRQIADRAEVGVGSINYHFQSKEALLNDVVGALMMDEATKWFEATTDQTRDPVMRLRQLFKETSRIGVRYPKLLQLMIGYGFQTGDWTVPTLILPLLREIFGSEKDDLALRLMALQLVLPIQMLGLHPDKFRQYAGLNMLNDQQRDQAIDLFIDNLIDQGVG